MAAQEAHVRLSWGVQKSLSERHAKQSWMLVIIRRLESLRNLAHYPYSAPSWLGSLGEMLGPGQGL